ncbi:flagellar motor protein MotB [Ferrimonas sediminicola]|uniref:Flagellar motor protein MotB n=1 Tax=Ferrimonas sediminicola TaxID=2569538 RepID=A0A4U1B888_9GAMM|nr:flagellar motor protein MotB [Ferrimonas sediminicola]TKB46868.1 flagellar motor protein MotB [Ferrimonas sediminicola]
MTLTANRDEEVAGPKKRQAAGAPAWMATFADLSTLLMCFFVLLLAFSEMDVLKFKQIAGSMKYAFGVQNKLEVKDIPKGTSVIAQEFRPGRPEPTPIEVINQQTIQFTKNHLDVDPGRDPVAGSEQTNDGKLKGGASEESAPSVDARAQTQAQAQSTALAKKLAEQLQEQIEDGAIEIESLGQQIVIRIREKGAFPANSAFLQPKFRPVIQAVAGLLKDVPGIITITGHTDNAVIHNELYRSNWELSAQRAVSVAHEMIKVEGFEPSRMEVIGKANTQPLVSNDEAVGRAKNRRVEIAITQGKPKLSEEIPAVQ